MMVEEILIKKINKFEKRLSVSVFKFFVLGDVFFSCLLKE